MENYKVFSILFNPFNIDIVSGVLWDLAIDGITEEENYIKVYSKQSHNLTKNQLSEVLESLKAQNLIETYSLEESVQEQQNWNEYWEKRLNIIKVTDRIVIKPSFKEYEKQENEIIVEIDPKMSFGTGEHETTKLCITAIDEIMRPGFKAMDLGSGTAVLAITAAKLGASRVLAVDNDEWCLLNGKENIELNNVQDKVDVILGVIDDIEESNFDLIIANINKSVLLTLGDKISERLTKAGKLILSGLYNFDIPEVSEYYSSCSFTLLKTINMKEWSALIMQKN